MLIIGQVTWTTSTYFFRFYSPPPKLFIFFQRYQFSDSYWYKPEEENSEIIISCSTEISLLPYRRILLGSWCGFVKLCVFLIISKIFYKLIMLSTKLCSFLSILVKKFTQFFAHVLRSIVESNAMLKISFVYFHF